MSCLCQPNILCKILCHLKHKKYPWIDRFTHVWHFAPLYLIPGPGPHENPEQKKLITKDVKQ